MNFINGTVVLADGHPAVRTASGASLPIHDSVGLTDGMTVTYGIRPEHFEVAAPDSPDAVRAKVVVIEPTGAETMVYARIGDDVFTAVFHERHTFEPGQDIALRIKAEKVRLFSISGERIGSGPKPHN